MSAPFFFVAENDIVEIDGSAIIYRVDGKSFRDNFLEKIKERII